VELLGGGGFQMNPLSLNVLHMTHSFTWALSVLIIHVSRESHELIVRFFFFFFFSELELYVLQTNSLV
jgi:hypothetical protein